MNPDARVWKALLLVMAMGLAARPSVAGAPPPPPPDCWKPDPAPILQIRLYLSPSAWDITSKTAYFAYTPWKNDLSDYGIEVHRHDSDTIYPQCGSLPGDSYSDSSWAETELVNLAVPAAGTYEARGLFRDNTTPPFTPPAGTGQDGGGVQYERVATAKMIATTVSELDWLGVGETVEVTATVVPSGVNGSGDDNNYLWQQSGGHVLFVVGEEEVGWANGRTVTIIGKTPSPQMDGTYVAARFTTGEDDVGRTITTFYTDEYFTVVGVNLNVAGVSEAQEEDPGKFMGFNNDDDNGNGVPDYQESGPVAGENDLAALSLSYGPPDLNVGQVTLMAVSGGSKIKLWTTSTKGTQVSLPASWNLASQSVASTLYVEGVAPSGGVRDVQLKLSYNNGEAYHDDRVNLTIVETDLDIEEVADENEANPGGFVGVNNDDDNGNGTPDKDEAPVSGEDNLIAIPITLRPSLNVGLLKLEASTGGMKVKVWSSPSKSYEVVLPQTVDLSSQGVPSQLYVEGVAASGAMRDVTLKLSYIYNTATLHADPVRLTVVEADLDIAGLSDAEEEDPGGFIGLNDDDDNGNSILDKDEAGTVVGENDLLELALSCRPFSLNTGAVKLEYASASNKTKVWENSTKGTEVALPKFWYLSTDTLPAHLYVEGVNTSASLRDIAMKLSYILDGTVHEDGVKFTVLDISFKEDVAQDYGFDDYTSMEEPWKSVETAQTDSAMAEYDPGDLDIFFRSVSTTKVTVSPSQGTGSPQALTFTGVSPGESEIQANQGSLGGHTWGKMHVADYNIRTTTLAIRVVHEENDDIQVIPMGQGQPNATAITAGGNSILETTPGGDDTVVGQTITTGPDGICNTAASGDDVQAIPINQGRPNQVCVSAGPNAYRDTNTSGDDVVSGQDITTGPDGICSTAACNTDIMSTDPYTAAQLQTYLNDTIYNQAVVEFSAVDKLPPMTVNFDLNRDGHIDVSTWMSAEMQIIRNNCDAPGYDHIIFLVDNPSDNSCGFMMFNQKYGFVHGDISTYDLITTAHELGHGAFGLQHTPQDTDNIMYNYSSGTGWRLRKNQWDACH